MVGRGEGGRKDEEDDVEDTCDVSMAEEVSSTTDVALGPIDGDDDDTVSVYGDDMHVEEGVVVGDDELIDEVKADELTEAANGDDDAEAATADDVDDADVATGMMVAVENEADGEEAAADDDEEDEDGGDVIESAGEEVKDDEEEDDDGRESAVDEGEGRTRTPAGTKLLTSATQSMEVLPESGATIRDVEDTVSSDGQPSSVNVPVQLTDVPQ